MPISGTAIVSDSGGVRLTRRRAILTAAAGAVSFVLGGCATVPPERANAAPLIVLSSGGFKAAVDELGPRYEATTRGTVRIEGGPSMGKTPQAIPARLARGDVVDVVIMVREALDELVDAGQVRRDSVVDLATSRIAMVVRKGAPHPDISTLEAFRHTLLSARSIAYSDSASGVHLSGKVFPALGLADQIAAKARMIPATPVGRIVASGEAEIGFQQLSELKAIDGVDIVGLIPEEAQKTTTFSAGIVSYSPRPEEGRRLIAFLASPEAMRTVTESGMVALTR